MSERNRALAEVIRMLAREKEVYRHAEESYAEHRKYNEANEASQRYWQTEEILSQVIAMLNATHPPDVSKKDGNGDMSLSPLSTVKGSTNSGEAPGWVDVYGGLSAEDMRTMSPRAATPEAPKCEHCGKVRFPWGCDGCSDHGADCKCAYCEDRCGTGRTPQENDK